MQILHMVHALPPKAWAGTEWVTLHLSQVLRARGHELTMFTHIADADAEEFSPRDRMFS